MYWLNVSGQYVASIVRTTEVLELDAEIVRRKYCVARVRRFEVV
jgi:hypothetical protein